MSAWEVLLVSVGVAMDAFAVSVSKGLATPRIQKKDYLIVGIWFGGFQALMPLIGYFLGAAFYQLISDYDHWIAFGLLTFVGLKMLIDTVRGEDREHEASFSARTMIVLAVATSIDALAVGLTLAVIPDTNVAAAITSFGVVTFAMSAFGLWVGHMFGGKHAKTAGILGGIILIFIGTRILIEHLMTGQ